MLSSTCLCTNRQLAFNLDCEGANSTTINHFTFFYALSLSISAHCASPLFLLLALCQSLSHSHTHMHKHTPQGRCRESMLHCSTALLFSMHPAVHGLTAITPSQTAAHHTKTERLKPQEIRNVTAQRNDRVSTFKQRCCSKMCTKNHHSACLRLCLV